MRRPCSGLRHSSLSRWSPWYRRIGTSNRGPTSGAVLDLIGHGNRANLLPVEYYQRPVQAAAADDLAEYLLPANIAKRGREATAALGDDPAAAVRSASELAVAVIGSAPHEAMVGTPFGERSLDSYPGPGPPSSCSTDSIWTPPSSRPLKHSQTASNSGVTGSPQRPGRGGRSCAQRPRHAGSRVQRLLTRDSNGTYGARLSRSGRRVDVCCRRTACA